MANSGSSRRIVPMACQAGLVVGMLLILAGALWQALVRPRHVWSESKAQEHRAARTAWHDLQYDDPQQNSEAASVQRAAQLEAARQRFERIQAELDDAISTHRGRGTRLMYAGLASVVLFGVGYLSSRER